MYTLWGQKRKAFICLLHTFRRIPTIFTLRVTGINTGPFNSLVELLLTAYIDNSYTRYSYATGRRKRFL